MRFDTPNERFDQDFSPIPKGVYSFTIKEAGLKTTKRGDGKYVKVALEVMTGPQAKRLVFANFNVENPNEQAQKIGRGQFKRFLSALSINKAVDLNDQFFAQITNKLVRGEVDIEEGFEGKDRNVLKKILSPDGTLAASVATSPKAVATDDPADFVPF